MYHLVISSIITVMLSLSEVLVQHMITFYEVKSDIHVQ